MTADRSTREHRRLQVQGVVQGIGFRPFVYRLASQMGLAGRVRNAAEGVQIDLEGEPRAIEEFLRRVVADSRAPAGSLRIESHHASLHGYTDFAIAQTTDRGTALNRLAPDRAACRECLADVASRYNRRARYPFTSCARCGPRYTIASNRAFDRATTSMARFPMCDECRREYEDPHDRRFHAQTTACPTCGPRLRWESTGDTGAPPETTNDGTSDPIASAVRAIRAGGVITLHGVGGFQLVADARQQAAVRRIRAIKHREQKPFAVMFPSLRALRDESDVSPADADLLQDPAAPIVLVPIRPTCTLAPAVSPGLSMVGAMLPSSPLHHLLLDGIGGPVIATSGNMDGDPILTDPDRARRLFASSVDGFLVHDRPIARRCDDSVARIVHGRPCLLRRARGYVPSPVMLRDPCRPVLAMGGHLKVAVAVAQGREATLSPHIGDLETVATRHVYAREIDRLLRQSGFRPEVIACDQHPDYYSTRYASTLDYPIVQIQHHEAHVAACAAEHHVSPPYLGVAWDGIGYGRDGSLWGSEFFLVEGRRFQRVAHLRPFRLPGGEASIRDGRRIAVSLLVETGHDLSTIELSLSDREAQMFERQTRSGMRSPWTTSAGRLFDGVAALTGIATRSSYEGDAAGRLEDAARMKDGATRGGYEIGLDLHDRLELDWRRLVDALVDDVLAGVCHSVISARFHRGLAESIVAVARQVGVRHVVLSGGVFQNAVLATQAATLLEQAGHVAWLHRQVPPNDGGLALGQAVLAGQEG